VRGRWPRRRGPRETSGSRAVGTAGIVARSRRRSDGSARHEVLTVWATGRRDRAYDDFTSVSDGTTTLDHQPRRRLSPRPSTGGQRVPATRSARAAVSPIQFRKRRSSLVAASRRRSLGSVLGLPVVTRRGGRPLRPQRDRASWWCRCIRTLVQPAMPTFPEGITDEINRPSRDGGGLQGRGWRPRCATRGPIRLRVDARRDWRRLPSSTGTVTWAEERGLRTRARCARS